VPPSEIAAIAAQIRRRGLPIAAVALGLLAVGAWFLAAAIVRRRADQARLWELAHQDGLTGLPNRILFFDRLGHIHRNAQRYQRRYALLYLDLNGFKAINDRFGHDAGDEVLITVAQRLGQRIRGSDTVARIGGDELAVILSEFAETEALRALAHELIELIERPMQLGATEVSLGASIGAATYPTHGDSPDALLRGADQAMYRAKTQRLGVCFAAEPAASEADADAADAAPVGAGAGDDAVSEAKQRR
jgi:diguanylate cyclase (GGDEF)-like protein